MNEVLFFLHGAKVIMFLNRPTAIVLLVCRFPISYPAMKVHHTLEMPRRLSPGHIYHVSYTFDSSWIADNSQLRCQLTPRRAKYSVWFVKSRFMCPRQQQLLSHSSCFSNGRQQLIQERLSTYQQVFRLLAFHIRQFQPEKLVLRFN